MIMFDGYLTGKAEKHFIKKSKVLARKIILFSFFLALPTIIFFISSSDFYWISHMFFMLIVIAFIATFFPKRLKSRLSVTPKKIYIKDEQIVCIADKYEEIRNVTDVKKIYDYDEFFEIVFPFGKVSEKFVCQKELLVEGSLENFETLFKGKIIRPIRGRFSD